MDNYQRWYGIVFGAIFVSLVIMPIMADLAYGNGVSWDNTSETARAQRDSVIAQYQWFPIFISAMIIVWMFWSSSRKDQTVEEASDW